MRTAFPRFTRSITAASLLLMAVFAAQAAPPTAAGAAMSPLQGLPYRLYARQADTDARQAVNCLTAVVFALQGLGHACPSMTPYQALTYWRPRAQPLRLGQTLVDGAGLLLFTREHFLLFHADIDDNGTVDAQDEVIHAYYRPVAIERLGDWLRQSRTQQVWSIPIDGRFACPSQEELARLPRRRP